MEARAMLTEPKPVLVTDLLPKLLSALLDLLDGLSSAEWALPTAAAGWDVRDVALHLLGDEINILSGKRDQFRQSERAPEDWPGLVKWLNERNETWVKATRRLSPRLLCELLQFTGEEANACFRSLDPYAIGGPVSWAGPEPAPVWLDLAREYTERWHHQQHIREAVGRSGLTEPLFLHPVLATFVRALPWTCRALPAPEGAAATLSIAGEAGGVWSVVRTGGGWKLYDGRPAEPRAAVELPADVAWRLFTRGIDKSKALVLARLDGDRDLGLVLLDSVSIIA